MWELATFIPLLKYLMLVAAGMHGSVFRTALVNSPDHLLVKSMMLSVLFFLWMPHRLRDSGYFVKYTEMPLSNTLSFLMWTT